MDIGKILWDLGWENTGSFHPRSCVADRRYLQFPDETGWCFRGHVSQVRCVRGYVHLHHNLFIDNQLLCCMRNHKIHQRACQIKISGDGTNEGLHNNGSLRRCHAKLRFLVLFIKTEIDLMNRFIVPNFVNLWSFRKIRCLLPEIWESKVANIYKEIYARGIHFFVLKYWILANLGSHISKSLQRNFLKLHRLTKFGTINRFIKMNFCFDEKHKKSQFCVTSSQCMIHCVKSQLKCAALFASMDQEAKWASDNREWPGGMTREFSLSLLGVIALHEKMDLLFLWFVSKVWSNVITALTPYLMRIK